MVVKSEPGKQEFKRKIEEKSMRISNYKNIFIGENIKQENQVREEQHKKEK